MTVRKPRPWWRLGRDARTLDRRALIRAIMGLPIEHRDVFVLHRFAGMSLDQIAEHLGIDREVAEARFAAALVQLCRAVPDHTATRV